MRVKYIAKLGIVVCIVMLSGALVGLLFDKQGFALRMIQRSLWMFLLTIIVIFVSNE